MIVQLWWEQTIACPFFWKIQGYKPQNFKRPKTSTLRFSILRKKSSPLLRGHPNSVSFCLNLRPFWTILFSGSGKRIGFETASTSLSTQHSRPNSTASKAALSLPFRSENSRFNDFFAEAELHLRNAWKVIRYLRNKKMQTPPIISSSIIQTSNPEKTLPTHFRHNAQSISLLKNSTNTTVVFLPKLQLLMHFPCNDWRGDFRHQFAER